MNNLVSVDRVRACHGAGPGWESALAELLAWLPLSSGVECAALGCATPQVLGVLAGFAGPCGYVTALDSDPAAIAGANAYVWARALNNVSLLPITTAAGGLLAGRFDLVHASGLLGEFPAPERLLAEVAALARPGGWVVLQEVDAASWEVPADHPRRDRSLEILRAATAWSRPDCARFLPHWLRRAGLGEVQTRSVACTQGVDQSHARAPVIGPDVARRLLRGGLGTSTELETLRADLVSAGLRFTAVQAWGRRPARADQGLPPGPGGYRNKVRLASRRRA